MPRVLLDFLPGPDKACSWASGRLPVRAVEKRTLSLSPGVRILRVKELNNRISMKEAFSPRLVALQARPDAKQAAWVASKSED